MNIKRIDEQEYGDYAYDSDSDSVPNALVHTESWPPNFCETSITCACDSNTFFFSLTYAPTVEI